MPSFVTAARTGITTPRDPDSVDVVRDLLAISNRLEAVMAMDQQGTYAAMAAASSTAKQGTFWTVTDRSNALYRHNGTAWGRVSNFDGPVQMSAVSPADTVAILIGAAGQAAAFLDARNAAGVSVFSIQSNGSVVTGSNVQAGGFTTPGGIVAGGSIAVHGSLNFYTNTPQIRMPDANVWLRYGVDGEGAWSFIQPEFRFNTVMAGAFVVSSSGAVKQDVSDSQYGLDTILALQVKDYVYKTDPGTPQTGMIAEQVAPIYPPAVMFNEGAPTALDYGKFVAPLIVAVQELNRRIDALTGDQNA